MRIPPPVRLPVHGPTAPGPYQREKSTGVDLHHSLPLGSRGCNRLEALHLAHHEHNRQIGPAKWPLEGVQREQERENPGQGIGPTFAASVETILQKNEEGEPAFREFVTELILRIGPSPKGAGLQNLRPNFVLSAGAEWSGMNPKTCYPYLNKMTNPINGFLRIRTDQSTKARYLGFRFELYYELEAKEILKLHPKEGLRFRTDQAQEESGD